VSAVPDGGLGRKSVDMRRIHGAFGYCAVDKSDLLFTSSVNLVVSVISCGRILLSYYIGYIMW
jgi:hypothetical protein